MAPRRRTKPLEPDLSWHSRVALSLAVTDYLSLARRWRVSAPFLWRVARGVKRSRPLHRRLVKFILQQFRTHGVPLSKALRTAIR